MTNCAFQTWNNGNITETSGFYTGDEAKAFEESHYTSGTFATLHTFESVEEGMSAYYDINDRNHEVIHPEEYLEGVDDYGEEFVKEEDIVYSSWEIGGGSVGTRSIMNEARHVDTGELLFSWVEEIEEERAGNCN